MLIILLLLSSFIIKCAGYEGSFGHETIDAQTFAKWGIDFVEEDSCYHPSGIPYPDLYGRMRDALNATGQRPENKRRKKREKRKGKENEDGLEKEETGSNLKI